MAELSTSRLLTVAASLLVIGTLGFYHLDGMIVDDAEGDRWVNAFYCCVMTLTTVGYGDICPSQKLSNLGRMFIVFLSLCGLGMFCGPVMVFASSWTRNLPGGALLPGLGALVLGMMLFTQIEDMEMSKAAYLTFITGTSIGYGDLGPSTDMGRLSTAFFAILAINVVGGLLEPARVYLSNLCIVQSKPKPRKKKKRKKN